MKKITILFLVAVVILSAGCIGGHSDYKRSVLIYSVDSSGTLNWNKCIDCSSMETANSLLEDKNGNFILGGSGVSEQAPGGLIPEIVWVSPGGELIDKKFYGTKGDGWITTLSNDTKGNIFAVFNSGKSMVLDETGAQVNIIPVNVTGPGWWISLRSTGGYVAADRTEAFAISDNGSLLWHTVFQDNETFRSPPLLIVNDDGNYVIASPYTYEDENYILFAELDKEGNIIRKIVFPNMGIYDSTIFFMEQKQNGGYEFIGNSSIFTIDENGENLSVIPGESIDSYRHYCKNGRCYAELFTGETSWFGPEEDEIRFVKTNSSGDVVFENYYGTGGSVHDYISDVIETPDGGYAILVRHETYE